MTSNPGTNWWTFPFNVGQRLASLDKGNQSACCAVLLPVVDYSASIVIAGLLVGKATQRLRKKDLQNPSDHFERLRRTPLGTRVLICYDNQIVVGKITGRLFDRVERKEAINIEYTIDGVPITDPYHARLSRNIFEISEPAIDSIRKKPGFLEALTTFAMVFEKDVRVIAELISGLAEPIMIVGDKNEISEEAKSGLIMSTHGYSSQSGQFNDLLQVENLSGSLFAWVKPVSALKKYDWLGNKGSQTVIFRGSKAFLRHSHNTKDRPWVAIFGANETRVSDAVTEFNSMFVQRTSDLEECEWPTPVPGGELMGFWK